MKGHSEGTTKTINMVRLDHTYSDDAVMFDPDNNRILRMIDKANDFLLDDSVREALISSGLVGYEIVDIEDKRYVSICPFMFPNDVANWSLQMFVDYCKLYDNLRHSLSGLGLSLIDGHPWNTVFYFSQPRFVDLGSIVAHRASGIREFRKYRRIQKSFKFSAAVRSRSALESQTRPPNYVEVLHDFATRDPFIGYKCKLKRVLGMPAKSPWAQYYNSGNGGYKDEPKEAVLRQVLLLLRPETVYDIGCNSGHYSLICESYGCNVISCDPDPVCIDDLYLTVRGRSSRILPLVADMSSLLRAVERMYAHLRPKHVDLALLLALVHHLVYRQNLSFDSIFQTIKRLGAKTALIELVNKEDENVSKWDAVDRKDWYTVDEFIKAGRKYYSRYELFSAHDRTRPIVLFMD